MFCEKLCSVIKMIVFRKMMKPLFAKFVATNYNVFANVAENCIFFAKCLFWHRILAVVIFNDHLALAGSSKDRQRGRAGSRQCRASGCQCRAGRRQYLPEIASFGDIFGGIFFRIDGCMIMLHVE